MGVLYGFLFRVISFGKAHICFVIGVVRKALTKLLYNSLCNLFLLSSYLL